MGRSRPFMFSKDIVYSNHSSFLAFKLLYYWIIGFINFIVVKLLSFPSFVGDAILSKISPLPLPIFLVCQKSGEPNRRLHSLILLDTCNQ